MTAHLELSPWPPTEVSNNFFFALQRMVYQQQKMLFEHAFQINVSAKHKESAAQQQTQAYMLNGMPIKLHSSQPFNWNLGIVKRHIPGLGGIPFPLLLPE